MKICKRYFISFIIIFGSIQFLSAQSMDDSLMQHLENLSSDTARIDLLIEKSQKYRKSDTTISLKYAHKAVELSLKISDPIRLGDSYYLIGLIYKHKSEYEKSLQFLNKSLSIREKISALIKNPESLNKYANCLQSIGNIYYYIGVTNEAMKYHYSSIHIFEKAENFDKVYLSYITIAAIYNLQKQYNDALKTLYKISDFYIEKNDSVNLCLIYNNIGSIYGNMKDYKKALRYFFKAKDIADSVNNLQVQGSAYANIGETYKKIENYDTALVYLNKSLEYREQTGNPFHVARSYSSIGNCYYYLADYNLALDCLNKAYEIASQMKSALLLRKITEYLSLVYYKTGNYQRAYDFQLKYKEYSDSIISSDNTEELTKLEMQYKFDKQFEIQELEKQKAEAINKAEIQHQKDLRNLFIAAFVLMAVLVLFLIRSHFIKQKRNKLLAVQKIEIQEKNEELTVQKNEIEAHKDEIQLQKELLEEQNKELEKHRNELEKLVEERTADLKIAKEKAEEADRLKTAFLANMSHEIRTPMNAIIGFSDIIINQEDDLSNLKELLSNIIFSTKSLQHLLNNIIDVAKIESGQIKLYKEEFNLSELIKDIIFTYQENELVQNDVQLLMDDNEQIQLVADKFRLRQVLSNIIENAVKYTEKGRIETGFYAESNSIIFYVKDTGIGMSDEKMNEIFKRFTKIENEKEKLYRGAGLGLYICKNLVELMGGKIWLDSRLNVGTNFFFSIPLNDPS